MNGFLIADKPTGMTSSNLVVFVRRRLARGTTIGHGGTLDPDASGVLPVCIGTAARLFNYIIDKQKIYEAELQLGIETNTQDATGEIVRRLPVTAGENDLRAVLPRFTGSILQIPPMYSAIKRNGQRLYKLARKGETIEVEPRACRVDSIELLEKTGEDRYRLRVCCGKGVYIRTLCNDIGAALGCGGHMASLRRTAAGIFTLADALTPDAIDAAFADGSIAERLLKPDAPLDHLPMVRVNADARHAVLNGNVLRPCWMETPAPAAEAVRIYLEDTFAGIGTTLEDGSVKFRAMLLSQEDRA